MNKYTFDIYQANNISHNNKYLRFEPVPEFDFELIDMKEDEIKGVKLSHADISRERDGTLVPAIHRDTF